MLWGHSSSIARNLHRQELKPPATALTDLPVVGLSHSLDLQRPMYRRTGPKPVRGLDLEERWSLVGGS